MRTVRMTLGVSFMLLVSSVWAAKPPVLDGFMTDSFWASQARTWTLRDTAHPSTIARCYLGYDDQNLYFAADVSDPNVIGTNRANGSKTWEDDAVKLLLHTGDPTATAWTAQTFSYTFSALGGATWMRGPLPAVTDPNAEPVWPPTWKTEMTRGIGLKPGTTPNVSGKPTGGYVIESRIPWKELGTKPPFKPGSTISVCIVVLDRPEMSLPNGHPLSSVPGVETLNPANPSEWQRIRLDWQGPLPVRGLVEPLPLWLGCADPSFAQYQANETDPHGAWLDRARWTSRLDLMRSQNFNTLLLRHPDPMRGLLAGVAPGLAPDTRPASAPASAPATQEADRPTTMVDRWSRTGYFSADEFARQRDQFRWILAEAKQHGIAVHLLLDSSDEITTQTPTSQPATQSAPENSAADNRASIAHAVKQLFETYPGLAGLAAGPGVAAMDTLEPMASAMMNLPSHVLATNAASEPEDQASKVPTLLIWSDSLEPEQAAKLVRQYPHTQLLHGLQGEQWYKPLADSRITQFTTRTEQLLGKSYPQPLVSIAVGSLRGASSYMFWADPNWVRTLLLDLRNRGIQGFLLDSGPGEHGLAREAVADYAYNIGQQYSPARWESRLKVYGVGDYAGQMLELIQHASAIMPETLRVMHDESARFMPQMGMLLVDYSSLPSYSITPASLDDPGRVLPSVPVAWPDPVWTQNVAGIGDEVAHVAPADAVSAFDIAAGIGRHVDTCKSILSSLRHLDVKDAERASTLSALLDSIEFNVAIGDHVRWKMQAAIGWAQYKSRRGRSVDCISPLQQSVESWKKVVELAERLYPQPVPYWQLQMVSPPPWSPQAIHAGYTPRQGGWAEQMYALQRELDLMQEISSSEGSAANLPLWDQIHAIPSERRQTRFVFDFEKPDRRYTLSPAAALTKDRDLIVNGGQSILVDTRGLPNTWHEAFTTDPGLVPLAAGQRYQVIVAYRVVDSGQANAKGTGDEPFEIGMRPFRSYHPLGDHRCWTAPDGYMGIRIMQIPPAPANGYVLYFATRRPCAIVIDQVQIAQVEDR